MDMVAQEETFNQLALSSKRRFSVPFLGVWVYIYLLLQEKRKVVPGRRQEEKP